MTLSSQLTVRYVDDKNTVFQATSAAGSAGRGGLNHRLLDNGVEFTMEFVKEQFTVPVRFTIEEDHFKAEIAADRIVERGINRVIALSLLPYFGAGGQHDDGYMLVPDGSGALINFNNGKRFASDYSAPVYGLDDNYDRSMVDSFHEQARLPVFGIKKNDGAFTAIIADNEGGAVIRASVGGKTTSYNNVFAEFQYRSMGSMTVTQKNFGSKDIQVVGRHAADSGSFEVRYYFQPEGMRHYSGMAQTYRDYLVRVRQVEPAVENGDIPFYLDLFGFIKKKKPILGIPFQRVVPLTDFQDAAAIVGELTEGGVGRTIVRYNGWIKDSFFEKIPSVAKVEEKLGGQQGLEQFANGMNDAGNELFLHADFLNIYKLGNGFSKFSDPIMTVVNAPAMQSAYNVNIYNKDHETRPWYLLSPRVLTKFVLHFLKSFDRLNDAIQLSLGGIGGKVYSDLGLNGVNRAAVPALYEEALAAARESSPSLMTDTGNAYVIPYSRHIIDAPAYSSQYDITDETVPFYQIALHGLVSYSGPAVNLTSNPELQKLRSLETGSAPLYAWIAKDTAELRNTKLDYLFSADYRTWIKQATEDYAEINAVLSSVAAEPIRLHEKVADGVYRTVYGDRLQVIVNYNAESVTVRGIRIAGFGYAVLDETG